MEALIAQKEQELREIHNQRVTRLEDEVYELKKKLTDEQQLFTKLHDDFQYNLVLLAERDSELQNYDATFETLNKRLFDKDREIEELKIAVSDLESQYSQEKIRAAQNETFYHDKLVELKEQLEEAYKKRDEDLRKQTEVYEGINRNLHLQLHEREAELQRQKRELRTTTEDALMKQELEFKQKEEQYLDALHQLELKLKDKDHTISVTVNQQTKLEEVQQALRGSEKLLKHLEWELEDTRSSCNTRIKDLELDNSELRAANQSLLREYEEKMTRLLETLHTTETEYAHQSEEYEMKLQKLERDKDERWRQVAASLESKAQVFEAKWRANQEEIEKLVVENKNIKWEYEQQLNLKHKKIEQVAGEIDTREVQHSNEVQALRVDLKSRDAEIILLKQKLEQSKQHITDRRKDIELLKKEILAHSKREGELQRELAQIKSQFERKIDEAKHIHLTSKEAMEKQYEQATEAVQLANNRNKELEEMLKKTKEEIIAIRRKYEDTKHRYEEELRAKEYKKHQQLADEEKTLANLDREKQQLMQRNSELENQNHTLRAVITDMRQEMEQIHKETSSRNVSSSTTTVSEPATPERKELRNQLEQLNIQNQGLKKKLEEASLETTDNSSIMYEVLFLRKQVQDLNSTITKLKGDLMSSIAESYQHKTTLASTQSALAQAELELENKKRSAEVLELEVANLKAQLKEQYSHLKNNVQNTSATLAGTSFLQSLLEGSSMNAIRSLKKETKALKAKLEERDGDIDRIKAENSALKAEILKRLPHNHYEAPAPEPAPITYEQLQEERAFLIHQNELLQQNLSRAVDELRGKPKPEPKNLTLAGRRQTIVVPTKATSNTKTKPKEDPKKLELLNQRKLYSQAYMESKS